MVQANLVVEGDPPVARMPVEVAPEALYHCATPEQAAWAAQQLGPQPVAPFTQPLHGRATSVRRSRRCRART